MVQQRERKIATAPLSLVDIDAKMLNKILKNWIQQYMKGLYIMTKWDLSQECQDGLTPANQLVYYISRIKGKSHMTISIDSEKAFIKFGTFSW